MFFKKAKKTTIEKYKEKRDFFEKIYRGTNRNILCTVLILVFTIMGFVGLTALAVMTNSLWSLLGIAFPFLGAGTGYGLGVGFDELNGKLSEVYSDKLLAAKQAERMLNIDSKAIEDANYQIDAQENLISNSKDTIKYTKRNTKYEIKKRLNLIKELIRIKSVESKDKVEELKQEISQLQEKSKVAIEDETKAIEESEKLLVKAIERKNDLVANPPVRTDNMLESQKNSEDTENLVEYSDSANDQDNPSDSEYEENFDDIC